jgi:hypothetical protein
MGWLHHFCWSWRCTRCRLVSCMCSPAICAIQEVFAHPRTATAGCFQALLARTGLCQTLALRESRGYLTGVKPCPAPCPPCTLVSTRGYRDLPFHGQSAAATRGPRSGSTTLRLMRPSELASSRLLSQAESESCFTMGHAMTSDGGAGLLEKSSLSRSAWRGTRASGVRAGWYFQINFGNGVTGTCRRFRRWSGCVPVLARHRGAYTWQSTGTTPPITVDASIKHARHSSHPKSGG